MMSPLKKLIPGEAQSTDDLIAQIENKDRRFRMAQTVFMVGTFVALIIVIGFQNRTLNGVNNQLTQAKEQAARQEKSAVDARDKIIRRLDCMTVFFSQTDRTNLTIDNIDKCTLNRDGNLQQFFTQEPGQDPVTTKTEQQSPPKVNSTPPIQGGGANPGQPSPTGPLPLPPTPNQPSIIDILNGTAERVLQCQIRNIVRVCQ